MEKKLIQITDQNVDKLVQIEHIRNSNLKMFGVADTFQRNDVKEKIKQTMIEKYGVQFFQQTLQYHKNKIHKYVYESISFDSSWELAYFIFLRDHNLNVKRCDLKIPYEFQNKTHYYFPDFQLDDQIIEIKGSQFFTNGIFDGGIFKKDLDATKIQCMKENNVKIVSDDEIKVCLEYVNTHYGKDFLKKFRKKN